MTDDELAALDALGKEGVWRVGADELKLTNLDKPLFAADPPITKRELIRYFARIAPTMLPHLRDRPLNLQRFPNGAGSPGFWQKDIPETAPRWLTRWRETGLDGREDRGANDHLIADRAATLCWLGNQASFEIHAWTGRLPEPWRPTFAYIDIDPGERTTWEETLVLARLYRTALGHLGVRGYPKTTGKRGIQVWIPIEPRYEFADTSAWVEKVSRAVGATVPGPGVVGVGQGGAQGPRPARLHPEREHQDARRAVRRPAVRRGAGLRADRLGRAGRPGSATRPLDDPDDRGAGRRAGRPVRRRPDRRAGAPQGLTPRPRLAPVAAWQDARMHDETTIQLRQPDADDASRAWMPSRPRRRSARTSTRPSSRTTRPRSRWIGSSAPSTARRGSATGGAYSLQLTVPGGAARSEPPGSPIIAVAPTHRRRGILRQMMRWLLDQARDRGEPVAILWASEGAIYQHFGYGTGTVEGSFDLEKTRARFARPAEPLGRLRFVDPDEAMRLIPPIYDALRPSRPGWVSRNEAKWRNWLLADAEWMRHGNGPKFMAVLEVDGVARGYAIYRSRTTGRTAGRTTP